MKFEHMISTVKRSGFDGTEGYGVIYKSRDLQHEKFASYTVQPGNIKRDIYSYEYTDRSYIFTKRTPKNNVFTSEGASKENSLTHTVIMDKSPDAPPCEYISSPSFIGEVSAEEVNSSGGTDYVAKTDLFMSQTVTVNRVMNFIGTQNRLEAYKSLLYAVMKAEDKESPIIICDTEENIPLWIGAVQYSLPRHIAFKTSFTTSLLVYDGAPFYRICGLCPSDVNESTTDYITKNAYCIFDMINGNIPEYPLNDPLFAFLADGMLHSYSDIEAFHTFIESSFPKISEAQVTNAYAAYKVVYKGIANVTYREFANAAVSANNFGSDSAFITIAESCLSSRSDVCEYDEGYIAAILLFICGNYEILSYKLRCSLREFICRVSLAVICTKNNGEEKLDAFYDKAKLCAETVGFSLAEKLLSDPFRKHIINTVSAKAPDYKLALICKMCKEYTVKKGYGGEDITSGSDTGSFIFDFVRSALPYAETCCDMMLKEMSYDPIVLCASYLVIDEAIGKDSDKVLANTEETFLTLTDSLPSHAKMCEYLISSDRPELSYAVFSRYLSGIRDCDTAISVFDEHDKKYFDTSEDYCNEYAIPALELLADSAKENFPDDVITANEYVLRTAAKHRVSIKNSEEICQSLTEELVRVDPNRKETEFLWILADYIQNICKKPLTGRLLCLCFAEQAEKVRSKRDFDNIKPTFDKYTEKGKVPLSVFDSKECEDYAEHLADSLTEFLPESEDLCTIYSYFDFTSESEEIFITEFIKPYIKDGKSGSDFKKLCSFLQFTITTCTEAGRRAAGVQIARLNAKNAELLKEQGEDYFADNATLHGKFTDILNTEPEKGSIFKKIFGKK